MSSRVVKLPPGCMVTVVSLVVFVRCSDCIDTYGLACGTADERPGERGTDQASLASDLAITIFSAQTLTALIRPLSIPLKSACDRLSERSHKLMADLIVLHSLMGA